MKTDPIPQAPVTPARPEGLREGEKPNPRAEHNDTVRGDADAEEHPSLAAAIKELAEATKGNRTGMFHAAGTPFLNTARDKYPPDYDVRAEADKAIVKNGHEPSVWVQAANHATYWTAKCRRCGRMAYCRMDVPRSAYPISFPEEEMVAVPEWGGDMVKDRCPSVTATEADRYAPR